MQLVFELSMPNRGSWNGRWSGEDRYYAIVRNFPGLKGARKAREILEKGSYFYSWTDGWGASVNVREIDGREARRIRSRSKGFCGYDWMVRTICDYGKIMDDQQLREHHKQKRDPLAPLHDIAANHSTDPLLANIEQGVRDGLAAADSF